MAGNSKSELLEKLAQGDAMHGWGAILALGRDTANQLLQARFVSGFSQQQFFRPISGEYYADEQRTEHVVFDELMVGPPELSFEQASGRSARVIVTLELIAGRCSAAESFPGQARRLRRSHELSQGLGYRLEMSAELVVLPVPGSRGLQLAVDLSAAINPTCNLAVSTSGARRMGEFILEQLKWQPVFNQAFSFFEFLPYGNDVMALVDVALVTQKAPDGEGGGSMPHADGAVLMLMQLPLDGGPGTTPDALPYLLPHKGQGSENVGVALLLERHRASLKDDQADGLLPQLILPEGLLISLPEAHVPHDSIWFGELSNGASTRQISPGLASTGAGGSVAFAAVGGAVHDWQARDISRPRVAGEISATGVYKARPNGQLVGAQRIVAVSAKASEQSDASALSALLIESSEPLTISPRVSIWYPGYDDVAFTCSGEGDVKWSLSGEPMGGLQPDPQDPRKATFKPDAVNTPLVRLQRVEVSVGQNKGHAIVVLLSSDPRLNVEPHYVPGLSPGASMQFTMDDFEADRWEVVGEGSIDASTGRYTAPAQATQEASVVVAFASYFAGVAVVEHQGVATAQAMALQERWRALREFELVLNNERCNKVFANGYQQVGIDIVIATQSFTDSNGEVVWDPVSDLELASLVLLDQAGNRVPYLSAEQAGIPEGAGARWMASKRRNHFDYYPTANAATKGRLQSEEEGTRRVTVYVHSREAEIHNFSAEFQDYTNGWRRSLDVDQTKGRVQLEGVELPAPSLGAFVWPEAGKRVASTNGYDYENDTFNHWHFTTDYWELAGNGIQFVNVEFDSTSMLKWESEQLEETFATYTGIAFKPRRPEDAPQVPAAVQYQAELQLLAAEAAINYTQLDYRFKGQEDVTSGALLITLDRISNFAYWDSWQGAHYRNVLQDSVRFTVTDNYGNPHKLRLLFTGEGAGRNRVELRLQ
nr:hypothetical protein [uncultured Pseudomonas sp.]